MKKLIVTTAAGIIIAVGAYFSGIAGDLGSAVKIAFDADSAKAACVQLIDGNVPESTTVPAVTE